MYQFLLLSEKLPQNLVASNSDSFLLTLWDAGRLLLFSLGVLLWLHSAGRMSGHWDSGASLSSGLSSWAFLGHGSLGGTFQEGVGKSVICTTSLLHTIGKVSHKCTSDWRAGEVEATSPQGKA